MGNKAKILLERINNEFNLSSLKDETDRLLDKAPVSSILEELQKKVNDREALILKEAVAKLKGRL